MCLLFITTSKSFKKLICYAYFPSAHQRCITKDRNTTRIIIFVYNKYKMRQKSTEQKTEDFYKIVEAGDIALFNSFQEAVFFLGNTKAGKTTSCHCLCGSPLRAENINGQLVYRPSTNMYSAKIGNHCDSETEIPNIFLTSVKDPKTGQLIKTVVMDQPGYGDTYGFHRIFSNGYFHYRSFSKAAKIKFVLVFSLADLQADAAKFKKTIFSFISIFNSYASIRKKIQAATSCLITKVQQPLNNLEALKNKLIYLRDNATKNMGKTQKEHFQSLMTSLVQKNKVYWIEKPKQAGVCTVQNKILQNIYFNSEFWQRPRRQKYSNLVSMQHIKFSVANQVVSKIRDQDQLFQEDFQHFMKFMQQRVNSIIFQHPGSLLNVVKRLIEDAQDSNQSNQFLSLMKSFNQQFYKFDPFYNRQRKQREIDLFKQQEYSLSSSSLIGIDNSKKIHDVKNMYFIKKFKVLQELESIGKQQINQSKWIQIQRTIQQLQETSFIFRRLFKKISFLATTKEEQQQTIYKYSYIIQRLIEEYKIITLILFLDKNALQYLVDSEQFLFSEDLTRSIKDRFFTSLGELTVRKQKFAFILNFNFNQLPSINEDIIQFCQDLIIPDQKIKSSSSITQENSHVYSSKSADFKWEMTKQESIKIMFKISQLLKRHYKQFYQSQVSPSKQQKINMLKKLYQYRTKFYNQIFFATGSTETLLKAHTVSLTKLLAKLFMSVDMLEQAKDCYISINDANSLLQIYHIQANSTKNIKDQRLRLINYGKEAIRYDRKHLAKECFQKAYSLCEQPAQFLQVSTLFTQLYDQKLKQERDYIQKLRKVIYCSDLSQRIKQRYGQDDL